VAYTADRRQDGKGTVGSTVELRGDSTAHRGQGEHRGDRAVSTEGTAQHRRGQ